ncbi:LOW QUALITY PROTEIN: zinc transporter ZIP9-like [Lampetra planeri]
MDGGWVVAVTSVLMFAGCFLVGFVPLLCGLSERKLRFVSVLGAGLLCGTALSISIPEGVGLLQESWGQLFFTSAASSSSLSPPLNSSEKNTSTSDRAPPPRFVTGVALTLGFAFMFVVDQTGSYCSTSGRFSVVCGCGGGVTATLGLVIHAAADGFALGAAVATGRVTLQLVVFLCYALCLSQVPAAFGLVSFLVHAGLEKKLVQGHLLVFSAAAPTAAVPTYFLLHASQQQLRATGVGMLFSAGTFLYVAMAHVLPEISSSRADQAEAHPQRYLGLLESLTLLLGAGLPVLLALGLRDD